MGRISKRRPEVDLLRRFSSGRVDGDVEMRLRRHIRGRAGGSQVSRRLRLGGVERTASAQRHSQQLYCLQGVLRDILYITFFSRTFSSMFNVYVVFIDFPAETSTRGWTFVDRFSEIKKAV